MHYLYGDSSPSSLDHDFIEFLRECVDFCVAALLADERARLGAEEAAALRKAAESDGERLKQLSAAVTFAVQGASSSEDSPAARCGAEILRAAEQIVAAELERIGTTLRERVESLEAQASRERKGCFAGLEKFLLRCDFPNTIRSLELRLEGERYSALLKTTTDFGLSVAIELELPDDHPFAEPLKLDRVVDRVEVQAPDGGRLFHKEGKLRAQRLEKMFVTELVVRENEGSFRLRTAPSSAQGLDVRLGAEGVYLLRVPVRDGASETPLRASDTDAETLTSVLEKLAAVAPVDGLERKSLAEATLDDRPLNEHEPATLVERVVSALAPIAQEIARRSPSPGELVLKRLLGDNRREEIFVTKAELRAKLEPLTPALRALFSPLGLTNGGAQSVPPRVPPPVPGSAAPPSARLAPPPTRVDVPRRPVPLESRSPADGGTDLVPTPVQLRGQRS